MIYRDFAIEAFEVGRDQWHARFRRLDRRSTVIDGIEFEFLDVGFAWASADAALADARSVIDRMCTQAFASHITGMPPAEARSRDAYIANRMAQTLPTAKASVAAMDNAQAQVGRSRDASMRGAPPWSRRGASVARSSTTRRAAITSEPVPRR